jgi:putative addiction module component (TIGR02574 family)
MEVHMSDDARKDAGTLLSKYLETPRSEWLHQEIEGKPDSYEIDVTLTRPEGGATVIKTNAGAIRSLIDAAVQTVEAESEDDGLTDEERAKLDRRLERLDEDRGGGKTWEELKAEWEKKRPWS